MEWGIVDKVIDKRPEDASKAEPKPWPPFVALRCAAPMLPEPA